MNRIREIRERVGLTRERLAQRANTTPDNIWRLECGRTRLTQQWMLRLGRALGCDPAGFILNVPAKAKPDVVPLDPNTFDAVAAHGLRAYRVIERSVLKAGIAPGDIITVDESEHAVAHPQAFDIVLVEIGCERHRVLRQFVPPAMLVTNRTGPNMANNLDDLTVTPKIVGVVLRPKGHKPT